MFESSKGDGGEFRKIDFFARLLMGDTWSITKMVATLIFWLIGWSNVGMELALRFGHGSRYISTLRLVMGFITMNVTIMIGTILASLNGYEMAGILWSVANLIYIPLAVARRMSANRRLHGGDVAGVEDENSEYMGTSYLFLLGNRFKRFDNLRFVYRWAEPALCILLAMLVDTVDPGVSLWMWWCGVGLFLHNGVIIRQAHYKIQDVVDAQKQGGFVMDRIGEPEQPVSQTAFTVSVPPTEQTVSTTPKQDPQR